MKQCPICRQTYDDQTNFCLSDGATLIFTAQNFPTQSETPTVVGGAFSPQFQTPPAAVPAEPRRSGLLTAVIAGLLLLGILAAVAGVGVYKLMKSREEMTVAANNKPDNKSAAPSPTDNGLAENLKRQQEKLDRDKEKLEKEKRDLEAKKREAEKTSPTETPDAVETTTATIIDPPTNIRATPNGRVICIVRQRSTVNILGATGVREGNGTWYFTDACGGRGVVHSSQIRF